MFAQATSGPISVGGGQSGYCGQSQPQNKILLLQQKNSQASAACHLLSSGAARGFSQCALPELGFTSGSAMMRSALCTN